MPIAAHSRMFKLDSPCVVWIDHIPGYTEPRPINMKTPVFPYKRRLRVNVQAENCGPYFHLHLYRFFVIFPSISTSLIQYIPSYFAFAHEIW